MEAYGSLSDMQARGVDTSSLLGLKKAGGQAGGAELPGSADTPTHRK